MRVLEIIHWRLALWFSLKLFFTPLKFPIPHREREIRQKAIVHKMHTGKSAFTTFEWGSGKRKVLLMHGWSGRATQFFKIIEVLVERGFHVFSIEAPAHGESTQRQTSMLEFVDAIASVAEKFGSLDYGIGHSLGGMAIFNAFERKHFTLKKVIVIGTPANIDNVVHDFAEKVGASAKVAQGIIENIESSYSMKTKNSSTDALARRYKPAGFIIHDADDLDVDVKNAKALKAKWPNANIMITNRLGHRKILMERKVIDTIVGFLPLD